MYQSLRRVSSLPSRARSSSAATPLQPSDTSDSEGYVDEFELASNIKPPKPVRSPLRSPLSELRKHLSRPSLKREATSPVYLDPQTVSVSSIPSAARRVAQCVSSRLRSNASDVASISSNDSPRHSLDGPPTPTEKKRRNGSQRNKWTKEETEALVSGCNKFGIGQWKAIRDADPVLAKRSPGDLKDRFRTYFPDAYRKHYPNAKTHMSDRQRSKDPKTGKDLFTDNAARKERKQFSAAEDEALKRGYAKHGTAWSCIARDPILAARKSTDLRDRFRNAFPDLYAAAGYKSRPRKVAADLYALTTEQLGLSTGTGMFDPNEVPNYPVYSSRTLEHVARNQLPSLDFLKTHGADAFAHYRGAFHTGQPPDFGPTEDQVPELRVLTNTVTPRPNMLTPRPIDTTPRPCLGLASIPSFVDMASVPPAVVDTGSSEYIAPSYKPSILHKTQSSMDLSQFSHLNLGNVTGVSGNLNQDSPLSPASASNYEDFAHSAYVMGPYGRGVGAYNYSSPELSAGASIDPYYAQHLVQISGGVMASLYDQNTTTSVLPSVANVLASGPIPGIGTNCSSHDESLSSLGGNVAVAVDSSMPPVTTTVDWPNVDLDAASRTFSAFTCDSSGFHGIMNMEDAQSSTSSLQSSLSRHSFCSSSSQADDQVLYTGMDHPKVYGAALSAMHSSDSLTCQDHGTLYPSSATDHQF